MAEKILTVNALNDGVWTPTTDYTDLNTIDTEYISVTPEGSVENLNMTTAGLSDADTITDVTINIRALCDSGGGKDFITANLIVNGSARTGVQQSIGTSYVDYSLNDPTAITGWNEDWTATQLDNLDVRISNEQTGMGITAIWQVDFCEIVITYTPAPAGGGIPPISHHNRFHNLVG